MDCKTLVKKLDRVKADIAGVKSDRKRLKMQVEEARQVIIDAGFSPDNISAEIEKLQDARAALSDKMEVKIAKLEKKVGKSLAEVEGA